MTENGGASCVLCLVPCTLYRVPCTLCLIIFANMKKHFFLLQLLGLCLFACNSGPSIPDVSNLKAELTTERFEQDFFNIDTNNVYNSLRALQLKYPNFLNDYVVNILGIPLLPTPDTTVDRLIRKFIADYRPIKDTSDIVFRSIDETTKRVKEGLRFAKYYFPNYKLPQKLITYIGPMDAYFQGSLGGYSDIITNEGLAVGLQLHLGRNYSLYRSEMGQELYPTYISRRFEPAYIPVNCMKNIIDDLFPEKGNETALIDGMVEKGKRLYVLDRLLPYTADTLKIGYTKRQLEGCYANEANIWDLFLRNNFIYSIDPAVNKNYIQDGPKTEELGDASPGFIGLFVGWQIVKKYMSKNSDVTLTQLMQMSNRKIFEESKYKPR